MNKNTSIFLILFFLVGFAKAQTIDPQLLVNIQKASKDEQCIGLRYTDQNGNNLGVIAADLTSFDTNGFTLDITYTIGEIGNNAFKKQVLDQNLIVLYTAYR